MKKLFFIMLATLTIAGCQKRDDGGNRAIEITSGSTQRTAYADETRIAESITFTTTGPWTSKIKTDVPKWIDITPSKGGDAGLHTIGITLATNTMGRGRTAEITLTSGSDNVTIKVEQKGTTESGETIVMKLVSQISTTSNFGISQVIDFAYDANNLITNILDNQNYTVQSVSDNTQTQNDIELTYSDNQIIYNQTTFETLGGQKSTTTNDITLALIGIGYINSGESKYVDSGHSNSSTTSWTVQYDSGYVNSIASTYVNYFQGNETSKQTQTNTFTWTNFNFTQLSRSTANNTPNSIATATYDTTHANNPLCNLDLNWIIYGNEAFSTMPNKYFFAMMGLYGKRSKNMVAQSSDQFSEYTYEYTYTDGYVTQVIQKNVKSTDIKTTTIKYK